ncbi:Sjogren's syndrome/scleroderma autoantigen 1 family protein [Candidatus Hecatella orcuttiae]|jgi:UPF0148 protein|uniref:Sjogren's syndrome/scleroderma autoantigen 1 family protein n=1 Tax=Candidatus Hecatella orcuttiae TaxID=1935119 RepID=UPI002867B2E2|nr:Sjogren's syndrome/scleroderma autoantigen 1 family protein [Candidatus Hecatella orcuttiae]
MSEDIRKMAEILKSGATMLGEACPSCSSPLFKTASGEIYCIKCQRKVVVVKSDEEAVELAAPPALTTLEETLLLKLQQLEAKLRGEQKPEALETLAGLAVTFLEALERVRRVRKQG